MTEVVFLSENFILYLLQARLLIIVGISLQSKRGSYFLEKFSSLLINLKKEAILFIKRINIHGFRPHLLCQIRVTNLEGNKRKYFKSADSYLRLECVFLIKGKN